jgi:hypothetical protein
VIDKIHQIGDAIRRTYFDFDHDRMMETLQSEE